VSASTNGTSTADLIEALSDPIWTVRRDAAEALGDVSGMYDEVVAGLTNALNDPVAKVRVAAAQSLGKLGTRGLMAVQALELLAIKDSDVESRVAAIRALGRMGEDAAPSLGRILQGKDPSPAGATLDEWQIADRTGRPEAVYEATLEALAAMGRSAKPAMDDLGSFGRSRYMRTDRMVSLTMDALVGIGPDAIEQLIGISTPDLYPWQTNWPVWLAATNAIGRLGPDAVAAVPALVRQFDLLSEVDGERAVSLVDTLYSTGNGAIPALMEGLANDSWKVRAGCANTLARFGTQVPSSAIPALAELTLDASDKCRASAARALGSMGRASAPAASALVELLSDDDAWGEAFKALGAIGVPALVPIRKGRSHDDVRVRSACGQLLWLIEKNPDVIPQIKEALELDRDRRRSALSVLASMGPVAVAAKSELRDILVDPSMWEDEHMLAVGILAGIGAPAARELVESLGSYFDDVKEVAGRSLLNMGVSALPALIEVTASGADHWLIDDIGDIVDEIKKDESAAAVVLTQLAAKGISDADDHTQYMVRSISMGTLALLKTQSSSTIRFLTSMFSDPDHRIRAAAAFAVSIMGSSAQNALGPLSKLLADTNLKVCTSAAETLASINTKSVRQLIDLLKSKSYDERRMAAAILWQMEKDAEPAIPALITALGDKSSYRLRSLAAKALGAIGSDAPNVQTALKQALNDSHPEVRESAQEAIDLIEEGNWWW